jgi:predicted LPLAT superfamily acyltransferase
VVVLLSAKTSANGYIIEASEAIYPRYEGRRDKVRQLRNYMQQYADILEDYSRQYPYQCFLFHDVWKDKGESASDGTGK